MLLLEAWQDLVRDNPSLEKFEPDVEGLMVNRISDARVLPRAHR